MFDFGTFVPVDVIGPAALLAMAIRAFLRLKQRRRLKAPREELRRDFTLHMSYLSVIAVALVLGSQELAIAVSMAVLVAGEARWLAKIGLYTKTLAAVLELKEHYRSYHDLLASEDADASRTTWFRRWLFHLRPSESRKNWHQRRTMLTLQTSARFALQTLYIQIALEITRGIADGIQALQVTGPSLHWDLFFVALLSYVNVLTLVLLALANYVLMAIFLGIIVSNSVRYEQIQSSTDDMRTDTFVSHIR